MEPIRKITNEQKDKALGHLSHRFFLSTTLISYHLFINFFLFFSFSQFLTIFQVTSTYFILLFTFWHVETSQIQHSNNNQGFGSTLLILFFLSWVKDDPGLSMFFFLSSYFQDFTVTWFLPDFFLQFCSTVKLLW